MDSPWENIRNLVSMQLNLNKWKLSPSAYSNQNLNAVKKFTQKGKYSDP